MPSYQLSVHASTLPRIERLLSVRMAASPLPPLLSPQERTQIRHRLFSEEVFQIMTNCDTPQFNHSCDGGNLDLVMVRCGSPQNPWGDDGPPGALLRAKRRIEVGEELTWDYNLLDGTGKRFSAQEGGIECRCGVETCSRFSFDQ